MRTLMAAIDCGTSSVKAAIFDLRGRTVSLASRRLPCRHFSDGRVEQDPRQIRQAAYACLRRALSAQAIPPAAVAAVAVANQRATVICIDARGEPLGPALVWQDMRGAPEIAALRRRIDDGAYYAITGLPNNPVFSLGKILHLKKNEPIRFKKTARFVLVHDYVLQSLGCNDFLADHSNAALTGLLDLRRLCWSDMLLELAGLAPGRLSALVAPGQRVGVVSREAARACGLLPGTPLVSGGGDQQCAGVGAGVVEAGICSITLGTAGVSFCHADRVVIDPARRITCCAHAVAGKWNVEGLQHTAGDALHWVSRHWLNGRGLSADFLDRVDSVPAGARGLFFYPYFAGAGAPHWRADATAMLLGLRHHHDQAGLMRAALEGVAFENRKILDVFAALKVPACEIRLTGGSAGFDVWNRMQADIYGRKVATLENPQATLLGAAILAACGVGAVASPRQGAAQMVRVKKVYTPTAEGIRRYAPVYRQYRQIMDTFLKHGMLDVMARR